MSKSIELSPNQETIYKLPLKELKQYFAPKEWENFLDDSIENFLTYLKDFEELKIFITGLAGSGKGTFLKKIKEPLDMVILETGNFYRVLTWYFLEKEISQKDLAGYSQGEWKELLDNLEIKVDISKNSWRIFDAKTNKYFSLRYNEDIRSSAVSSNISAYAELLPIRDKVNEEIKNIVASLDIVGADGRDLHEVFHSDFRDVLDFSKIIFWLGADIEELKNRARQRAAEEGKTEAEKEDAALNVLIRNERDNARKVGSGNLPTEKEALAIKDFQFVFNNSGLEAKETRYMILEALTNYFQVGEKLNEYDKLCFDFFVKLNALDANSEDKSFYEEEFLKLSNLSQIAESAVEYQKAILINSETRDKKGDEFISLLFKSAQVIVRLTEDITLKE
jgi:cytidylate kinase